MSRVGFHLHWPCFLKLIELTCVWEQFDELIIGKTLKPWSCLPVVLEVEAEDPASKAVASCSHALPRCEQASASVVKWSPSSFVLVKNNC